MNEAMVFVANSDYIVALGSDIRRISKASIVDEAGELRYVIDIAYDDGSYKLLNFESEEERDTLFLFMSRELTPEPEDE